MARHKKYHWYYRWWIKLRLILAAMIIFAGILIGLLTLLLPFESLYQHRLERFLQTQWDLDVAVQEIDGSWQGYGPLFKLSDLELTGKQSVQLASASLSINVYQLLIPGGRTGIDLSINRAELDMIHAAGGASITINDDDDESRFTDMLDRILTTGSLRVDEMLFNLADEDGKVLLAGLQADLLLQQDENRRAFQLMVENENQSIEVVSQGLRRNALTKDANWYVKFNQFELSELNDLLTELNFPAGQINGEIWASAVAGQIQSLAGEVSWYNPSSGFGFQVEIKQFSSAKNWLASLMISDIAIKTKSHPDFLLQLQRQDGLTQIKSQQVAVGFLAQFLLDMPSLSLPQETNADGVIDSFELSFDNDQDDWQGILKFTDLALGNNSFDLMGIGGEFDFNASGGNLLLDSEIGYLSIPEVYRGQLNWGGLSSQSHLDWSGIEPNISVNNFWCACNDFDLQLWANLSVSKPLNLLLGSVLSDVDVAQLYKYWPHNVWKPKTMAWLDRGLLGGQVETGYVFVNGNLVPKGFKTGAATFISRAYTKAVNNLFHPDWPQVNGIDAIAVFDHDTVQVEIQKAETKGIEVTQAEVNIESFEEGVLDVSMLANSQNNQILDYLRLSPMVQNIELSEAIKIGGKQKIDLSFDVSIKPEIKRPFKPQGRVDFNQGEFSTEFFKIERINGPVSLDGYTLGLNDLPAQLGIEQIQLNGEIVTKSDEGLIIDVNLDGYLSADFLLDVIQHDLPIKGESDWRIEIKNEQDQLNLLATSGLEGITIELPEPLKKSFNEKKQLTINCAIPCQESEVEINFNDEIQATLNSESGRYHLTRLQFKGESSKVLNPLLFGGQINRLNLDEWLVLLAEQDAADAAPSNANQWPTKQVQVEIRELVFMSRVFTDISLQIKRLSGSYEINIEGEQMQGMVILDDDLKQKGIVAEFEHLDWIEPLVDVAQIKPDTVTSDVPDLHLWAKSFKYAGIPLGEMRMEMRNVADGVKVEQLSLKSPEAEINASGFWNKAAGSSGKSEFNIVMISEKIADFLQQVGFAAPITNAQTLIELNAQWDGVPSAFNIATIDGALNIKIGQGQVLDQKPGFGRVLGLFNLTNLPRRLILDFRDVLADGLLFSDMEGNFEINAGVATTEDFIITASSAKIHITGAVGFADQSYNQTITIMPQIGKTFPTIGAIAGGPVGAAAGFLVQGLFDRQLKKGNEIIYQVTGSWDEPIIELIEKNN